MLPDWFSTVARDVTLIAALLTAFEVIRRVAIKPAWQTLQRINRTMDAVHEQLVPNGGGSLRDVCDRLEAQHTILSTRLDRVDERLDGLSKGVF